MWKREGRRVAAVALYAAAMGFLEAAVVVYLRMLYCSGGFGFPMRKFMEPPTLNVEMGREICTLVMILCVAYLASSRRKDRFAYFLLAFAVWDLFYYAGLKAALGWPASLLDWDLLFLVPWPWVGPVLAPVAASLTMVLLAFCLLESEKNLSAREWSLLGSGSLLILYTFLADYGRLIVKGGYLGRWTSLGSDPAFRKAMEVFAPSRYDWPLFTAGEAVILSGILLFRRRTKG